MENDKTFDLTQEAILVRLYIGQAGLSARSRTLTREAAATHNADPNSVRGIVQKLEATARAEITQAINQARSVFYTNTLPWDDNAYRLCPLTRYSVLRKELTALQNAFLDAVDALVDRYEDLHKDYLRRVNDLAQEIPFPSQAELRNSFRFELIEMPLANPNDVRLRHVDGDVVNELKDKVQRQMAERLTEAQTEIIMRLTDLVERVKTQCSKEDGRLFASLIGNIESAVDILPALNVSGDAEINRLIRKVQTEITSLDVEALRKDDKLRKEAANTATKVLDELRNFKATTPAPASAREPEPSKPEPVAKESVTKEPKAKAPAKAPAKAKATKVAAPVPTPSPVPEEAPTTAPETVEDDLAAALQAPTPTTTRPIEVDEDLRNFANFKL